MDDKQAVISHIREHANYPATKQALVEACNQMSDVAPEQKQWFEQTLPDGTYNTADDVLNVLGLGGGAAPQGGGSETPPPAGGIPPTNPQV